MTTTPEATKGVPRIVGDPAPTARADHNALADWVRDAVDRRVATEAARDGLSGKYVGMVVQTADTNAVWLCISAAGSGTWMLIANGFVGRAVRAAGTIAVNSSTFVDLSATANWSTSGAGQLVGVSAYANGWTVPRAGVYLVSYSLLADVSILAGVTVNDNAAVVTDLALPVSAGTVSARAAASASGPLELAANDVLRLWAVGSGSGNILASQGHFGLHWLREA